MDWRVDYDALTYRPVDVPADVDATIVALMRALRLRFGALDGRTVLGPRFTFRSAR